MVQGPSTWVRGPRTLSHSLLIPNRIYCLILKELADKDGNIQQALEVTHERSWQRNLKSHSTRNAFGLSGIEFSGV